MIIVRTLLQYSGLFFRIKYLGMKVTLIGESLPAYMNTGNDDVKSND